MANTSLDNLIEKREKLTQIIRNAELLGGKVSIGDDHISLTELKEMLVETIIEIESIRSKFTLKRVK